MPRAVHIVAAAAAALAVSGPGCVDDACTHTGCLDTVDVLFETPLRKRGTYVVDVRTGPGTHTRCTVSLPRARDAACDARWADVLAIPGQDGAIEGIVVYRGDVDSVTVSVAHDGTVVGGGTYTPVFTSWFPNGATCDEVPCQHGVVEVGVVAKP